MTGRRCEICGDPEDDDGTGLWRLIPGPVGWEHVQCQATAAEDAKPLLVMFSEPEPRCDFCHLREYQLDTIDAYRMVRQDGRWLHVRCQALLAMDPEELKELQINAGADWIRGSWNGYLTDERGCYVDDEAIG